MTNDNPSKELLHIPTKTNQWSIYHNWDSCQFLWSFSSKIQW